MTAAFDEMSPDPTATDATSYTGGVAEDESGTEVAAATTGDVDLETLARSRERIASRPVDVYN